MLTLQVPQPDESALLHEVETRPKPTAEWLARLPLGSPVETARQLVMALYALNRHALGEEERSTLLALFRPVVARVAASLEALLGEFSVPPTEPQRKAGGLLRELLIEVSIGYKHVLLALDRRRFGRNPPKRVAEVSARLLSMLRDIQAACHLSYSLPPDGLWLDMHQVYLLAHATGLADKAMDDTLPASLAYRQSLLLALADPPHMNRSELRHTRTYLEKAAALAELRPATATPAQCGFVIATASDRGPSQQQDSPTAGSLWLDTEALCRQLHETASRPRGSTSPRSPDSEPGPSLSRRLLKVWRTGAQRAFKRYAASGSTVQVVAGLSAIHRVLEPASQTALFDPHEDSDSLHIGDIGLTRAAPAAISITRWTVCNESAAGLALSGTPDAPLNLKVGEPIALRSDATEAPDSANAALWSLAVIRWIRMRDAQQVELGIERLSPQVESVRVRALSSHRQKNLEPALFIPGQPALKQPDRLLLPHPFYQSGLDAEVWRAPQQRNTLTFGRRLDHTASFDLIDFTLYSNASPP